MILEEHLKVNLMRHLKKSLLFFVFIAIIFTYPSEAQYFEGKILDEKSKPISGASIYFDTTNLGVISSETGEFKITIPNLENKLVVISYLGYEKIYINDIKSSDTKHTYILTPKIDELDEVLLSDSYFTREQLLRVFRKEFLGDTKLGKKCKILNEDAIRIKFDTKTNTISAFSREDLVVLNPSLNYKVYFNLIDFEAEFNLKSLNYLYFVGSFFSGTSYYEDIDSAQVKFFNRRIKTYKGSIQHFFKSMVLNKLEENEFTLAKNGFLINQDQLFNLSKEDGIYLMKLGVSDALKNKKIFDQLGREIPYFFKISVLYQSKQQTDIKFTSREIYIDAYGNYSPIRALLLTGEMAKNKLGGMLPSNFTY